MKVAIYKAFGQEAPWEADEYRERSDAYVRLSEIAEVDFQLLPPEVTVPRELAALDRAEVELRDKFNEKLAELNMQRANLRALTHQAVA